MIYIYDILLNFNFNLIEFYNWDDEDNIKYIKKIPIFKVSNSVIKDIIYNNIEFDSSFLNLIKNECLFFDQDTNNNYICILSDNSIVLGINIVEGKIKEVSRLLLDEESEVLNITNYLEETKINYSKLDQINRNINLSNKDNKIKLFLEKEFNYLYNNNQIERLSYYYYEYFNKTSNNKNKIYNELINSLNNINKEHYYLYEIINLSYQKKD